jgi:putative hydrolase of the HAD superfamily
VITTVIFDWGDTVMRDFPDNSGPMYTWDHVEWIPGAKELLQKLFGRFRLVIATNAGESDTADMIKALDRLDATRFFAAYFSSKDLGVSKPDPEFFFSICKRLNTSPAQCVFIGNSYEKDIVGAAKAGMMTVLLDEQNHYPVAPLACVRVINLLKMNTLLFDAKH